MDVLRTRFPRLFRRTGPESLTRIATSVQVQALPYAVPRLIIFSETRRLPALAYYKAEKDSRGLWSIRYCVDEARRSLFKKNEFDWLTERAVFLALLRFGDHPAHAAYARVADRERAQPFVSRRVKSFVLESACRQLRSTPGHDVIARDLPFEQMVARMRALEADHSLPVAQEESGDFSVSNGALHLGPAYFFLKRDISLKTSEKALRIPSINAVAARLQAPPAADFSIIADHGRRRRIAAGESEADINREAFEATRREVEKKLRAFREKAMQENKAESGIRKPPAHPRQTEAFNAKRRLLRQQGRIPPKKPSP